MPSGALIVESRPQSPEELEAFNRWYDDVHLPEVLAVDGFVGARRMKSIDDDAWVAVYEIDGDVAAAKAKLLGSLGSMSRPVGVQLSPPPTMRFYQAP
jgi:hypothetical protein